MDIVRKAKNWDTWEAIMKDLKPYFGEVFERLRVQDKSILQDFYILELIIIPKINVEFPKKFDELNGLQDTYLKKYNDVLADIMKSYRYSDKLLDVLAAEIQISKYEKERIREDWKNQLAIETKGQMQLHHFSDKLFDMLEAQTQISKYEKERIREDWRKQLAIETKGGEDLVEEDSMTGGKFKAWCDDLANCLAKNEKNFLQKEDACELNFTISTLRRYLMLQESISQASIALLDEQHKKQVLDMMAEDELKSFQRQRQGQKTASQDLEETPFRVGSLDFATLTLGGLNGKSKQAASLNGSKTSEPSKPITKENALKNLNRENGHLESAEYSSDFPPLSNGFSKHKRTSLDYTLLFQSQNKAVSSEQSITLQHYGVKSERSKEKKFPIESQSISNEIALVASEDDNQKALNVPGATSRSLLPRGLVNKGNLCFLHATQHGLSVGVDSINSSKALAWKSNPKSS